MRPARLHDDRHTMASLRGRREPSSRRCSATLPRAFTADVYTSVLPQIAFKATEAAARLVPQGAS